MKTWTKAGGWPSAEPPSYTLETPAGQATLQKEGARYVLRLGDRSQKLPKRATLDHAEAVLAGWLR